MNGYNTGNLLFIFTLYTCIKITSLFFFHVYSNDIPNDLDLIVIPASNWLNDTTDFYEYYKVLNKFTNIPILTFGLGGQSKSIDMIPILKPGTLKLLGQNKNKIFIRDEFTRRVCEYYKIDRNPVITGCPSILLFDQKIKIHVKNERKKNLKIIFHLNEDGFSDIVKTLINRKYFNWKSIPQNCDFIIKLLKKEELHETDKNQLKRFERYLSNMGQSLEDFKTNYVNRCKYFCDISQWYTYLRDNAYFTINTRIHGTIMSLYVGIPSICITHDTRTVSLCKTLKISNISMLEFRNMLKKANNDIEAVVNMLIDRYEFDTLTFVKNLDQIRKTYKKELFEYKDVFEL